MTYRAPKLALALAFLPLPLLADAPKVVTDIAPVHSLVAQVMKGVGAPELLTDQGTSPHHMQLRPSQARSLDQADLLVWVGPELTPWLERALDGLSPAHSMPLLDLPVTLNRPFGGEDNDHDDHDDHDDHGDDDHGDDDHGDHGDHDDHDDHEDHEEPTAQDDHGHSHAGRDPHAWLDPENAVLWLAEIAEELARIDPDHATAYRANAAMAAAALDRQIHALEERFEAVEYPALVTAHDAYGHFAARFHVPLTGHVNLSDAASPSAGHVAELQATLKPMGTLCLFTEPQLDQAATTAMLDGLDVAVLELDPLGSRLEPGEALYATMLEALGAAFLDCANGAR